MRFEPLLLGHLARALDAVDRRKRDLLLPGILAGRLTQGFRGLLDVEHVVDNLEGQSDVLAKACEGGELLGLGGGIDRTHAYAGTQQGSSLGSMDRIEQLRRGGLSLALEVVHLAANHSTHGAGGGGQLPHQLNAPFGVDLFKPRENLECEREQRVAGQDRDGVSEDLVTSGPAAPEIVVVESGEIIVDQGVSMNELENTRG